MDSVCDDWSSLPTELLRCIAGRIPMVEDFMAFRGVCTSWQAAATKDVFVSVSKVPLLMLAEKDDGQAQMMEKDDRQLYSLAKRKICMTIPVPGAKGKRCTDVGFGWIITITNAGEVSLLKPFTSARIELPSFKTFPGYHKLRTNPPIGFIRRAWLTANPSETSNFSLVAVMAFCKLGFWRYGGKWAAIKNPGGCIALAFCKGKLYCLDFLSHLLVWDPLETDLENPQGLEVTVANAPEYITTSAYDYLVVSTSGEVLMITRNNTFIDEYAATGVTHFRVMRVDLVKKECIEINCLGKDAIFLGNNAAVSVDATEFPGVLKPNCIYFTDDCFFTYHKVREQWSKGGGKDMGIYHDEDRIIERFDVESFSHICPPQWIFPSL